MSDYYDPSKWVKKPEVAKQNRENGSWSIVTDGEGENERVVECTFNPPKDHRMNLKAVADACKQFREVYKQSLLEEQQP
jgi:hypothetical protein